MKFSFITSRETLVTETCQMTNIEPNAQFMFGRVERSLYRNTLNTYGIETIIPCKEGYFFTSATSEKPFAVATNDSSFDEFAQYELSKVLLAPGMLMIHAFHAIGSKIYDPLHINVYEIIDPTYTNRFCEHAITIKIIDNYTTQNIPSQYQDVTEHAIKVIDSDFSEQQTPKYCFNPNRMITHKLFQMDKSGKMISYLPDGKKLVLNRKSKTYETIIENNIKSCIMRVYYSRKFNSKGVIYVDGVMVQHLKESQKEDYIDVSHIESEMIQNFMKNLILKDGDSYIVIVNMEGEIRPIYKSINGYSSFCLNDNEMNFITEVQ